jgi:CDP-glycerol glycerophosphotransferase (TagB/SpsB family)
MAVADLMLSDYSTVAMEFYAINKPVVFLDPLGELYSDKKLPEIYIRDAGVIVREPKYIRKKILQTLKKPNEKQKLRKKYTDYFFGPLDGHAAERGAEAIKELLG